MHISAPEAHYDVVVIGGGLVGASFAGLLAGLTGRTPLSILVVEAVAGTTGAQPSFDARSTALAWSSREFFESLGLWSALAPELTPIREIQVSDAGHFGAAHIDCQEHGQEALGYVAENRLLGKHLTALLDDSEQVAVLSPASIESVRPRVEGMQVAISSEDGEYDVTAELVVLCDGGRSPVSGQLGIAHERKQYGQHALIANIGFSRDHNNVAFERFTESGPLAVLPLAPFEGSPRGALVWTVDAARSEEFRNMKEDLLISRLQERFGYRLGTITRIGERSVYPLTLSVAREQVRPGLALLGNVAHTLHPVAGQGLNLALRDARTLARILASARQAGESPGAMATLQEFVERQAFDQRKAISLTDQMVKLFSSARASHVLARKMGMLSIDLLPGVRRGFARQAMGLSL